MDIATYQERAALTQPPVVHLDATPAQIMSGVLHNVIHFAEDADAIKKGLVYGYSPKENPKGDRLKGYDTSGKGFVLNRSLDKTAASELAHGTFGVLSEGGELAEALVTVLFGGDDIDWSNVEEEVGDFMWYLARIAKAGGFTLESAMAKNIAKLEQRHLNKTGGFNPEAGTEAGRDREAEKAAMDSAAGAPPPQKNYKGEAIPPVGKGAPRT